MDEVHAIDVSDNEMMLKAPAGLETYGARMEKIRFRVGNFNSLDLDPGSFDLIFLARALHHSNDVRATLSEVHRMLKPGGVVVCYQEHVSPLMLSSSQKQRQATSTTSDLTVAQYRTVFRGLGFRMRVIPWFRNDYRTFLKIPYNRRHLIQYTPRRWLNGLFHAHVHLVGRRES